jgi:RNase P subunit RPR2
MKETFCTNCDAMVTYYTLSTDAKFTIKGKIIDIPLKNAHCDVCHNEVFPGDVLVFNLKNQENLKNPENN